ncbi:MAG TPA: hypothetical protein VGM90_24510 [Kofleriaceae bacterium]
MIRALVAVLLFAGCSGVCATEPVDGEAWNMAPVDGEFAVEWSSGVNHVPVQTDSTGFLGIVHDSGTDDVRMDMAADAGTYALALGGDVPDLRALANGDHISVDVDGSLGTETTYCNFFGTAEVTISAASGQLAPSPDFVTDDFLRSADVVAQLTTFEPGVIGDGPEPVCPTSVSVVGHVAMTAANYSPVLHTVNCPDLSK